MSIKAIVDSVEYNGIEKITTGGKEVNLEEVYEGDVNINANGTYNVGGKARAIVNVSGESATLITKSINANGTYNANADDADGYSSVTVNVEAEPVSLQQKTATTNGEVVPDAGYDGLSKVVVNVATSGLSLDDVASHNLGINMNSDVVLSTATKIASGAFMGVPIKSITSDTVKSIGSYAFYQKGMEPTKSVQSVSLPICTSIGSSVFTWCSRLNSLNLPEVKYIGDDAFLRCDALVTLNFPKCIEFGSGATSTAADQVNGITSIVLPLATTVGIIKDCPELLTVSTPSRTTNMQSGAFGSCSKLTTVDCGMCGSWNANVFAYCRALTKVVLRKTDAVVSNTYGFGSGFSPANATLYVPSALVSAYQEHTRWKTFGNIVAIEGSEFDV